MLKQRIAILRDGGVIAPEVADFVNHTIDIMQSDYPQIQEDRATMFTTHLAMAAQRIKTGETVEMMEEEMWQEISQCPEFEIASGFAEKMFADGSVVFPESERKFLMLHICNMLAE